MSEILVQLKDSSIATLVIALITIFVVGCFKLIPGLKNMKSKQGRKAIFQILSIVTAGGLSILYHLFITKGGWDWDMLAFAGVVFTEVNVIYPLYENLGVRALFKKIVSLIIPSKSKKINETVDKVADALNIPEKTPTSDEVAEKQKKSEETGWLE